MTLPTIVPTGYQGTTNDFLAATKVDRSGAIRQVTNAVSIPAATATNTFIGLVPFNKGCSVNYGSRVYTADLDTASNATLDIGYIYNLQSSFSNDEDAFVVASSLSLTSGMIEFTAVEGMTWVAEGDGWITAQVNGATTTTGNITYCIGITYDEGVI